MFLGCARHDGDNLHFRRVNTRLLRGLVTPGRPAGELTVVDTLGRGDRDPGFADLGDRFRLAYLDAEEMRRLDAAV